MKIANIEREVLHIFWTTWGISIKLSGKMWHDNIKNHKKKTGLNTLSLEDTFFEKPQVGQIDLPSCFWVKKWKYGYLRSA